MFVLSWWIRRGHFFTACATFLMVAISDASRRKGDLFPIQMEAYETEDDWLERPLPTWKVRVSPVEQGWLLQDAEWECVVEVVRRNRWELYLGIEPDPEALAEVPF